MSIPLLFSKRAFHPRQLFSAMQGAWLEPIVGNIWQENTGVTPTTTGGQTLGLMLDQSQGAVLGPELVANGDFSNGTTGWTATTASLSVVSGALRITYTGTAFARASATVATEIGRTYYFSFTLIGSTAALGSFVYVGTSIGSSVNFNSGLLGIGTVTVAFIATATTTFITLYAYSNGSGQYSDYDNISVKQILGNHASQSVSGSRPTYQLDSNGLPLARHDTTDSLSVSLPAINVRRNLLTYSEQFDNGAWVKQGAGTGSTAAVTTNYGLAPDGTGTADRLQLALNGGTTGSDASRTYQAVTFLAATYTYSIWLRTTDATTKNIQIRLTSGIAATITVTATWQRFTISGVVLDGGSAIDIRLVGGAGLADSADILVWGTQLELGSVATDYQRVTDWTSEAYSSNGSVYFATPVGMSALHNQSMGTTYSLPALSSDIYSWIVVPQRLSTVLEGRLSRDMERKAGIAGPDYFDQVDYGPELVTNGDFSNGTTGWIISSDFIVTNGQAERVTNTGPKGVVQTNILQVGTTYRCSINIKQLSGGDVRVLFYVGSNLITFFGPGIKTFNAVCTVAGSIYIYSTANTCILDDISVRELKDGMTGQLLDDNYEPLLAG